MKSKLLLVLLISLSLFLSGCSFDETLESNQQHDGDDIDVVRDIGPQALDQVFGLEKSPSIAQGLDQGTQTVPVDVSPQVTDVQTTTIQSSSVPASSQNTYRSEDGYEGQDD